MARTISGHLIPLLLPQMHLSIELLIRADRAKVGADQFMPNLYMGSILPVVTLSFRAMLSGAAIILPVALMAFLQLSLAKPLILRLAAVIVYPTILIASGHLGVRPFIVILLMYFLWLLSVMIYSVLSSCVVSPAAASNSAMVESSCISSLRSPR